VDTVSAGTLGAACALGSALTWAVNSLLVRSLTPPFTSAGINAVRSLLGGGLLLAWLVPTAGLAPFRAIGPETLALLAGSIVVAIALGDTVFFESARALGVARALTVSMTYPLLAALLAAALLGEPLTWPVALGALLTLGGLGLIAGGRGEEPVEGQGFWWGVGAASLASVAWAVSVILLRPALAEVDASVAQAIRLPLAGALLWATPWGRGGVAELGRADGRTRWRIGALAGLTALSSVLFVAGVKYAGVAVASVLSSTAPMFAIPLALLFLGERLSLRAVAGTALTVAGIAVLQA
jgi:drug/metabolite transporter (DMT)-like permease